MSGIIEHVECPISSMFSTCNQSRHNMRLKIYSIIQAMTELCKTNISQLFSFRFGKCISCFISTGEKVRLGSTTRFHLRFDLKNPSVVAQFCRNCCP